MKWALKCEQVRAELGGLLTSPGGGTSTLQGCAAAFASQLD